MSCLSCKWYEGYEGICMNDYSKNFETDCDEDDDCVEWEDFRSDGADTHEIV